MKRLILKRIILITICVLLAAYLFSCFVGFRPYKDLKAEDIESASVLLIPSFQNKEIDDIPGLAERLNQIVIYNFNPIHDCIGCIGYAGGEIRITLKKKDGSSISMSTDNSVFRINGFTFRAKYEPCEALDLFAWSYAE